MEYINVVNISEIWGSNVIQFKQKQHVGISIKYLMPSFKHLKIGSNEYDIKKPHNNINTISYFYHYKISKILFFFITYPYEEKSFKLLKSMFQKCNKKLTTFNFLIFRI